MLLTPHKQRVYIMSTFKKQLSKAIKSVCCKLEKLSSDDFQDKINKFLYNERTNTILYAWNCESSELYEPTFFNYNKKELTAGAFLFSPSYKKNSSFCFDDQQIKRIEDNCKYKTVLASDDYSFKAAA
jgi:hypothetical protein